MVKVALYTLAVLSLSACVAARPDAKTTAAVPFTFVQWVEDIIADPHGDHLSPEEAVAAKNAAVVSTHLGKRVNCEQQWARANVSLQSGATRRRRQGVNPKRGWVCGPKKDADPVPNLPRPTTRRGASSASPPSGARA